ncbi:MAG: sulfotransferase family 2 domain-containing protein [Planctomycetes bacterium]|nr:sulfotransferase family 2 domain-containing protein [Planctomycetota bacterium]
MASELPATILAVHTPKAAGTTLKHHFETVFTADELLFDYADDPADPSTAWNLDPERFAAAPIRSIAPHRVVYGHFAARKYAAVPDAFRMTFLRHPVDNLVSIYRFWMKQPPDIWPNPLFRYVRQNDFTLTRFATLPTMRLLYSEVYYGGFDMTAFDFVGDYERYAEELMRLEPALGVTFDRTVHLNRTHPERTRPGEPLLGTAERATLTRLLARDIEFYEAWRGR